jgi:hypothetical protein
VLLPPHFLDCEASREQRLAKITIANLIGGGAQRDARQRSSRKKGGKHHGAVDIASCYIQ